MPLAIQLPDIEINQQAGTARAVPGRETAPADEGRAEFLLGDGIPLFLIGIPQREFAMVENKTYSKGLSALNYKCASAKPNRHF